MSQCKAPQVGHTQIHPASNPGWKLVSLLKQRQPLPRAAASKVDVSSLSRMDTTQSSTAEHVPSELGDALWTFARHPSTVFAGATIGCVSAWRVAAATAYPIGVWDAVVLLAAVGLWVVQEHAIHKYLLHSGFQWIGKSTHEAHHAKPYYHVSIDGPELVVPFMAIAGLVFYCLLQGNLALTASACTGYYTAGLLGYQLIHYLAHTRWVPHSPLLRSLRRHHQLHHLRNYDHWFAFCLPAMDTWLGTAPEHPSQVPFKMLGKEGAGSRQGGQKQPKPARG